MTRPALDRLPFAPLFAASGARSRAEFARLVSRDDRQVYRWQREGVTVECGEALAAQLRRNPYEVWPERRTVYEATSGDWRAQRACKDKPTSLFFPAPVGDDNPEPALAEPAKAICAACPVRRPCLVYAFEVGDYEAILGGTTGRERRRMARNGRKVS